MNNARIYDMVILGGGPDGAVAAQALHERFPHSAIAPSIPRREEVAL